MLCRHIQGHTSPFHGGRLTGISFRRLLPAHISPLTCGIRCGSTTRGSYTYTRSAAEWWPSTRPATESGSGDCSATAGPRRCPAIYRRSLRQLLHVPGDHVLLELRQDAAHVCTVVVAQLGVGGDEYLQLDPVLVDDVHLPHRELLGSLNPAHGRIGRQLPASGRPPVQERAQVFCYRAHSAAFFLIAPTIFRYDAEILRSFSSMPSSRSGWAARNSATSACSDQQMSSSFMPRSVLIGMPFSAASTDSFMNRAVSSSRAVMNSFISSLSFIAFSFSPDLPTSV